MSTEEHQKIIDLINELHPKDKIQRLQVINSIISGVVLALLIYTSNVIVNLFEKVRKHEVEIQNHIDMDLYRSMMIDYNFKVVNINNLPLNTIYQPDMILRGSKKE
jgi:hypothetical protein